MKRLLIILVLLWGGGALGWSYYNGSGSPRAAFRTAAIRRGDLSASIDATGTIEPEDVVDVGSQVAGLIRSFGEDPHDPGRPIGYGSLVTKDTVLARLDDSLYKARQAQARAGLAKAEAEVKQAEAKLRQARRELDRQIRLHQKGPGITSQQDTDAALASYENAEAAEAVARGAVEVAKADLEEASVNLGYTTIRSPVQGVILDRRVNIGQTVVAGLNASSLFLIAKDLKRMVIWASVNETDIGAVHVGQAVRFSVGAFPREEFPGGGSFRSGSMPAWSRAS
jgi:HlyD family secretion protein